LFEIRQKVKDRLHENLPTFIIISDWSLKLRQTLFSNALVGAKEKVEVLNGTLMQNVFCSM
jgi:hypothetical protein